METKTPQQAPSMEHIGWKIRATIYGKSWSGYESSLDVEPFNYYGDELTEGKIIILLKSKGNDFEYIKSYAIETESIYQTDGGMTITIYNDDLEHIAMPW